MQIIYQFAWNIKPISCKTYDISSAEFACGVVEMKRNTCTFIFYSYFIYFIIIISLFKPPEKAKTKMII